MTAIEQWEILCHEVNGRVYVGAPGVRDPKYPCTGFEPGKPSGVCDSDGHYMCGECENRVEGCLVCGQILDRCECEPCSRPCCYGPTVFVRTYSDSSVRSPLCIECAETLT